MNKKFEMIGWWALSVGATISFYYAVIMAWSWDYLWYSVKGLFSGEFVWGAHPGAFFNTDHLQISSSIGSISKLVIPILIGLILTWLAVYWIIKKGVLRVGKVVLITVPLPFIIIVVLMVWSMSLTGSSNGIFYYLYPDFKKLGDPQVWIEAYGQIFFSLSVGFGIMMAYASYMPKNSEINNATRITAFANSGTSFIAGFAVFSILGYFAAVQGTSVAAVSKGGPGLVFAVYPHAISLLPFGQTVNAIIAILLFLCLLTLGIDSLFSIVEGVATGLHDKFGSTRGKVVLILCIISFLAGLLFTTDAGLYWLDVVDAWASYGLVGVSLATSIVVGWRWDIWKLVEHINKNSIVKVGKVWVFFIRWFIPITLSIILIRAIWNFLSKGYSGYPSWAIILGGWLPAFLAIFVGWLLMKIPSKKYEQQDKVEQSEQSA